MHSNLTPSFVMPGLKIADSFSCTREQYSPLVTMPNHVQTLLQPRVQWQRPHVWRGDKKNTLQAQQHKVNSKRAKRFNFVFVFYHILSCRLCRRFLFSVQIYNSFGHRQTHSGHVRPPELPISQTFKRFIRPNVRIRFDQIPFRRSVSSNHGHRH